MQIEDLFNNYINSNYVRIRLKQSTIAKYYRDYETYLQPFFSNYGVNENSIGDFTNELLETLKEKTVCDILSLLSSLLKQSNIFIPIYKPVYYIEQVEIFTNEEWNALQNYCISHIDFFTFCILLSMYSGIRPGELCALRKSNLNFNNNVLKVRKTMQRIKNLDLNATSKTKIIIDTPKSRCSIRDIPIIFEISQIAKNLYKNYDTAFLLTNSQNKFIEPRLLENKFKELLQLLNIDNNKNLYTIRHTFATHFYNTTHDVKALSEILGHADIKTTLNRYVHSNLENKRAGLNLLAQKRN